MSRSSIVLPLAPRLVPFKKRNEERITALIGRNDKRFVNNICVGLYEQAFDLYLGGEIVRQASSDWMRSYEIIDIIATAPAESIRERFIDRLHLAQKEPGSDAWMHFGMTVQRQEGFHIKDIHCGSMFYADEVYSSPEHTEFRLTPAIYEACPREPSPIHLHLVSSLDNYRVLW